MKTRLEELEAQAQAGATAAKILADALERALAVLRDAGVTAALSGADATPDEREARLFAERVAAAREYSKKKL